MLWLRALVPAVVAAVYTDDVETSWLWQGLGVAKEAASISNGSVVVSDTAISRLSAQGEILWKQRLEGERVSLVASDKLGLALVKYGGTLEAYNLSCGAREWTYPDIDSFALEESTKRVAVERADKWAWMDEEWTPLNGKHIYTCSGALSFSPCPEDGIQIEVDAVGRTTLYNYTEVLWTRDEGLSKPVSACIVAKPHSAPSVDDTHWLANWRERVRRHTKFGSIELGAEDPSGLLVVLTEYGSLYALHTENGSVAWCLHEDLRGTLEAKGSEILVKGPNRIYDYEGVLTSLFDAKNELEFGEHVISGPGWQLDLSPEKVLQVVLRDEQASASVGVPLKGKDFRYKYINPNLAAVVSETNLKLVDAKTGAVLYRGEVEEVEELVVGEFWVAFTSFEHLHLWYIFESEAPNTRSDGIFVERVSVSTPEIHSLKVVTSKFGVTEQCILATDSAGRVLALPHLRLRAVARANASLELAHEQILSHNLKVDASLLVGGTVGYESTYIISGLGTDIFCTEFSPSGRFDQLKNFNYTPIIVSLLIVSYVSYQLAINYKQDRLALVWS